MIAEPENKLQKLENDFKEIQHALIDRKDHIGAAVGIRRAAEMLLNWLCIENEITNPPWQIQAKLDQLTKKKAFRPREILHEFKKMQDVCNPAPHDVPQPPTIESVRRAFDALVETKKWFEETYLGLEPLPAPLPLQAIETSLFTGRSDQIQEIHRLLHGGISPVVVHGPTGVGKTELVRQYANTYRHEYDGGIVEFDARSNIRIEDQVRQIFEERVNASDPVQSLSYTVAPSEAVQIYWRRWSPGRSLIIFDDVPSEKERAAEIKRCFPRSDSVYRRFDVLVTSQLAWAIKQGDFPLDELGVDASLDLFKAFVTDERVSSEEKAARKVCVWLGGLPIALELVARHMLVNKSETFTDILQRFERKGINEGALDYTHEIDAKRGWRESFRMVWDESLKADSRILLHLFACFPEGPVPERLIERTVADARLGEPGLDLTGAKNEVARWHLLKASGTGSGFQLHDLVRRAIRLTTNLEEKGKSSDAFRTIDLETWNNARGLRKSLANILETEAQSFLSSKGADRLEKWQDYVRPWSEAVDSRELTKSPAATITLLDAAHVYLKELSAYGDLIRVTGRRELSPEYLQEHAPGRARELWEGVLCCRVDALREVGRYQEARDLLKQIEETGEPNERKRLGILLKLADIDRLEGLYGASLSNYEEAEAVADSLTEASNQVQRSRAEARYGAARILRLTGQHEASLRAYQEAKALFEAISDAEPKELARAELGLGEIHRLMWKLDQSREHYLKALHCNNLDRQLVAEWGLGEWERLAGDPDRARKRYEKSCELSEWKDDIRGISWAIMGIGTVELATGQFEQALHSFEEADEMTTEIVEKAHLKFCKAIVRRKIGSATPADFAQCLEVYESREMNYCITQVLINLAMLPGAEESKRTTELSRARDLAVSFGYVREQEIIEKCKRGEDNYVINLP
jgi:tetratricopeptide (TPR) repeat protein